MSNMKWFALLAAVVAVLGLSFGCGGDSSGGNDEPTGTYAGDWTGKVCGRTLWLTLVQNGTSLTGNYTLSGVGSNADFHESIPMGTVDSLTPPATATLTANASRRFEITFTSYNSLGGSFINNGKACVTTATK